jgi:hypothetical protein
LRQLCATTSARLAGVTFFDSGYAAFTVSDASDEAVRSILAKDPRIAELDATFTVIDDGKTLDGTRTEILELFHPKRDSREWVLRNRSNNTL